MKTITILVTRRAADYHACPAGRPGQWGCGPNPEAAIRDFQSSHPAYRKKPFVVEYVDRMEESKAAIRAYTLVTYCVHKARASGTL